MQMWKLEKRSISKPVKFKLLDMFIFLLNPFLFWAAQPGQCPEAIEILTISESTGEQRWGLVQMLEIFSLEMSQKFKAIVPWTHFKYKLGMFSCLSLSYQEIHGHYRVIIYLRNGIKHMLIACKCSYSTLHWEQFCFYLFTTEPFP